MRTGRKFWMDLLAVAALTLAGGCGEDEITSPTTNGEPPEPPITSAPSSPSGISVSVQLNIAWVRWMPGEGASTQDVVLSRADGLEPERIKELTYVTTGTNNISFDNLTWGASYQVVVAAVNEAGRAESAPTSFEITIPEAPVLTWFSATRDPTCLTVEWIPAGPMMSHRVVVTSTTDGTSVEEFVRSTETKAEFCAADRPIFDGMTYTAQVVAEFDGLGLASDTRDFTVDFDPEYSMTGVWHGEFCFFGGCVQWTLDLVDANGDISGSWEFVDAFGVASSDRVTGTRNGGDFELALHKPDYDNHWRGSLEGPDRIRATVGNGLVYGVQLERE